MNEIGPTEETTLTDLELLLQQIREGQVAQKQSDVRRNRLLAWLLTVVLTIPLVVGGVAVMLLQPDSESDEVVATPADTTTTTAPIDYRPLRRRATTWVSGSPTPSTRRTTRHNRNMNTRQATALSCPLRASVTMNGCAACQSNPSAGCGTP